MEIVTLNASQKGSMEFMSSSRDVETHERTQFLYARC